MIPSLFVLALLFFAQTAEPQIASPQAGETLRGKIQITGNVNVENFVSARLSFSPVLDSRRFFIAEFSQIPADPTLAEWDTTRIIDGDYDLYLTVTLADGSKKEAVARGLKVRNDEIPPTATVAPKEEQAAPTETATQPPLAPPTPTPNYPTPTPLPPNPAILTPASILLRFAQGGLIAVFVIFLFSLILRSRKD